ncbi:MAG: hypothetical protein K0R24_994 [Gammaproteobacteria bacterium]|jgi:hypothetical protein|nr:hypothetical protein [Gammaproteobacteria bacterium]
MLSRSFEPFKSRLTDRKELNPAFTELSKAVEAMRDHSKTLRSAGASHTSQHVIQLADKLDEKMRKLSSKSVIDEDDWIRFKKSFLKIINKSYKDPTMRQHRTWKPMLLNLVYAVIFTGVAFFSGGSIPATIVGLSLLLKVNHSIYTSGNG